MHVLEVLDDDLGVELSPHHGYVFSYLVHYTCVESAIRTFYVVRNIVLLDSESAYQCERNSNYQYVIYTT